MSINDAQQEIQPFFNLASLANVVEKRASLTPDRICIQFLADGEQETSSLSFSQLDLQARKIASRLQQLVEPNSRALLVMPAGLEFVCGFFGCLYANVIAVPAYPPAGRRGLPRLYKIIQDAKTGAVLTTSQAFQMIKPMLQNIAEIKSLRFLEVDKLDDNLATSFAGQETKPESIAFLQYTSGSTGSPKGVMVTHANIMANMRMIYRSYKFHQDSVYVSWLPLFHDMGLIGGIFQTMFAGCQLHLMPTAAFLEKPTRWLKAITKYKATITGGPNFAYELCTRKTSDDDLATLNLSSLAVLYNGSEPVREQTLVNFSQKFQKAGFRASSFLPCYGLAEATLLVTGESTSELPKTISVSSSKLKDGTIEIVTDSAAEKKVFVSCGPVNTQEDIRIVDCQTGCPCAEGENGEIWLRGPNIAVGYWSNSKATEESFSAKIPGDTEDRRYLRTGDLGFVKEGQLYITGRLKDLIIIRGRNYYPQDIELCTESAHEALRQGNSAAFSVEDEEGERLTVVAEIKEAWVQKDLTPVVYAICSRVSQEHEISVNHITFVRPGTIAKTSSGKIQRRLIKKYWLEGQLDVVLNWAQNSPLKPSAEIAVPELKIEEQAAPREKPATHVSGISTNERDSSSTEQKLMDWFSQKLSGRTSHVDPTVPLSSMGLDSVTAIEFKGFVEDWLKIEIPQSLAWDFPTIREIAGYLEKKMGKTS